MAVGVKEALQYAQMGLDSEDVCTGSMGAIEYLAVFRMNIRERESSTSTYWYYDGVQNTEYEYSKIKSNDPVTPNWTRPPGTKLHSLIISP